LLLIENILRCGTDSGQRRRCANNDQEAEIIQQFQITNATVSDTEFSGFGLSRPLNLQRRMNKKIADLPAANQRSRP
jgi:hypothetical protein